MSHAVALTFCLGVALAQAPTKALEVGKEVPPLTGTDIEGRELNWQRFDGRAVLLFFHAHAARSATRSLRQLVEACAKDKKLSKRLAVLVVTDGDDGADDVRCAFTESKLVHVTVVDRERGGYQPYRAVAFPTVFAIDG